MGKCGVLRWAAMLALAGGSACGESPSGGGATGEPGVQCMQSSQCPSGKYCSLGFCVAGTPPDGTTGSGQQCACTGAQQCDESSGACVDPSLCVTDGDCASPLVCVQGRCAEEPECRVAADCGDGFRCDAALLVCEPLGCQQSSACVGGRKCDTSTGACVDCLLNTDCSGGRICEAGVCREELSCTPLAEPDCSPATPCPVDDPDCTEEVTCFNESCKLPSCGADSLEPDDEQSAATSVVPTSSGTEVATWICATELRGESEIQVIDEQTGQPTTYTEDISMIEQDEDWFFVDAVAGDGLIVRALYDSAGGETFTLELYDANGAFREDAHGEGGFAVLSEQSLPTAGAFVRVFSQTSSSGEVTLTFASVAGGICVNDGYESNDTLATATPVEFVSPEERLSIKLCENDRDAFSFTLAAGATFTVEIATWQGESPVAEVYALSPEALVLRDGNAAQNRIITATNDSVAAQGYALVVYAPSGAEEPVQAILYLSTSQP